MQLPDSESQFAIALVLGPATILALVGLFTWWLKSRGRPK